MKKYNPDNLTHNSLSSKVAADEKERERLWAEAQKLQEASWEINRNSHLRIKSFCCEHLERFDVNVFQKNFEGASRSNNRCNGWYYILNDVPVKTKFGKMYIALIVSVGNERKGEETAIFQECLIQIDKTRKEGKRITKLGLGMWHMWDGKCYKEIDDCPLGRREEYSAQNFDKFIKKSFVAEYL